MKNIETKDYIELGCYDEKSLKENTFSLKRLITTALAITVGACFAPAIARDADGDVFDELPSPPEGYVEPGRNLYDDEIEYTSYDYNCYMKDALENGLESWGADHLLKNVIGPIDKIKLGPEDTIEKVERIICYSRYGGLNSEEEWKERRKYVEVLYQIVVEKCKSIKDFDMKSKRWTLKRSEATGEERRLDFTNRKVDFSMVADPNGGIKVACGNTDSLCALKLILEYLLEHDPNEIADEVMLELYPKDKRSEALETDLFNLRVAEHAKKKTIRL